MNNNTLPAGTRPLEILKYDQTQLQAQTDVLAIEEPLEIQLEYGPAQQRQQKSISITMRTPGQDEALALGFLLTEGIVQHKSQIISTTEQATFGGNVILVRLSPNVTIELQKLERHFYTSSSCGVCGKSSIAAVHQSGALKLKDEGFHLPARLLPHLPERVRQQQLLFAETGGIHAAGLLDQDGKVLMVQEDVGRHNAVDKLIGQALLNQQLPLHHSLLLLSGRVSFELIQKALMAGIPMVAAVGAPSTLAIQLAKDSNMTVVGFLRNGAFNVYCGAERVSA